MELRRKTTLLFTTLSSVVILFSFTFIYLLSEDYTNRDFYARLQEKADFIAQKYFEKDELSKQVYDEIMEKNSLSLPEAHEIILDVKNLELVTDSLNQILPKNLAGKLLAGNQVQFRYQGNQACGIYYPDNQGTFIIIIFAVDKIGIQKQQHLLKLLFLIFFGSLVFIYFLGIFYAQKIFSPIGHILSNVKAINARNLSQRLNTPEGNDELTDLSLTLNQMLDRLDHAFDMQKTFISNASHELKNPLTAIIGESEIILSKERTVEEYIQSLGKITSEAERLEVLTKNLLSLAQADFDFARVELTPVRLDELLWETSDYFEKTSYKGRLRVHIANLPDDPAKLTIFGNGNLLKIALINLIDNGCKFSGLNPVDLNLRAADDLVSIIISDMGIGIPEKELEDIFQPFFRATNAVGFKGSGIGLSLTKKIVTSHGGILKITTAAGKGTRFEVHFDLNSQQAFKEHSSTQGIVG